MCAQILKAVRIACVLASLRAFNVGAISFEPVEPNLVQATQPPQSSETHLAIEAPSLLAGDPRPGREGDRLPLIKIIHDPIEGINRVSYAVSDKALYWVIRPAGKGYRFIAPFRVRRSIDNFGENLAFPVRLVNNVLQGKGRASAEETGRFVVNTTVGIGGLFDPASRMGLDPSKEDFGQTFGRWGTPPGFYLVIPVFGPSSARDGVGRVGDTLLNPATYVPFLGSFLYFNRFSFQINDYELLRQSESDPYVIMREFWGLDREKNVRDYMIPPGDYENEAAPTLEAVLFRVRSPRFASRGPERRVTIEATQESLPYSHWMQESPAPAVFIIPGLASHRNSEMVRALAEVLYDAGFSVIAVSSTFNWEFIRKAATTPVPGYVPVDSLDTYHALNAVSRDLEGRYPSRITSQSLVGLSLGGLQALFIADSEGDHPDLLRFNRCVALNPPADPIYSLNQLDAYYNAPAQWDEKIRARKIEETLMKAALVFAQPLDSATPGEYGLPFDKIESQFIIGVSYRYGLRNAIYESQRRQNLGVLKTPYSWFRREALYDEITAYSYHDYLRAFVFPYYQNSTEGQTRGNLFFQSAGLRSLKGTLATNDRVRVFTNWNDFVLSKDDMEWMKSALKDRITVFPEGGHLGNLHLPEVQKALIDSLRE